MRIIASLSSSWEIDPSNSVEAPNDVNPPFVIGILQRSKESSLLMPCGNVVLLYQETQLVHVMESLRVFSLARHLEKMMEISWGSTWEQMWDVWEL